MERPATMRETSTASIEDAARQTLATHPHFRGRVERFEISCQGGALLIQGQVPTFYLKQLVQCVLKTLEGVRRIENRVAVVSGCGLSSVA
jgi:hypothetical protein